MEPHIAAAATFETIITLSYRLVNWKRADFAMPANMRFGSAMPVYPKPPISEAIIEFQFAESMDAGARDKIKSRLEREYPLAMNWKQTNIEFDPGTRVSKVEDASLGYRLSDLDQTDLVIVADRRLSMSRLAPYSGWDDLRTRFRFANGNYVSVSVEICHTQSGKLGITATSQQSAPNKIPKCLFASID